MKFKKKLLALVLALILTVPTGICFAAENADNTNAAEISDLPLSSMEFSALSGMGMLGEDVISLKKDAPITRAQFIGSLYKVAGYIDASFDASKNPFIDVSVNTPYKDEISYFYNAGIINGTSANTFSPDAPVTYPQAAKMILEVCGYKEFTQAKYGTTLDSYVAMAMYINLTKGIGGITLDKPLTADQAVKLLYNAGRTKVMEATAFTLTGDAFYETYEGKELFSVRNNIYYGEGILKSNGLVSLLTKDAEEKLATIDNETYFIGGLNLTDTIGCEVNFFYKDEKGNKTLMWVEASDKNERLILTADDLVTDDKNYSMRNIVYEKNGKNHDAKISPRADIVYNNELYNNAGIDKLKPDMGIITLIDYDNDKAYDTVIVEEFTNIIVTGVINDLQLISGKYGNSLYFDDYERVVVYKDGVEASLRDLHAETSVSAVISDNKKLLVIHINDSWKQSKLVSISEEDEDKFLEFESGTYQISRSYKDLDPNEFFKEELILGGTYRYYLDRNGRIADLEMVTDGKLEYALVINAARKATGSLVGNEAEVKLLLLNGNIVIATTGEKMKLNGEKGKNGADFLNYAGLYKDDGSVKEQVVLVAFDSDGKIKELEFATDNRSHEYGYDKSDFTLDYVGTHSKSSHNSTLWWGKYLMGSHIKIFTKYTDLEAEEPYGVTDGSRIQESSMKMELYDCDENMRPAVAYSEMVATAKVTGYGLVSKIYYKNYNGEYRKYLGLYYGGSYIEYPEFSEGIIPEDMKRGDVVSIHLFKNQLTKVDRFISLADKPEPYAEGNYPDSIRYFGYLYALTTSNLTIMAPDSFKTSYGKLLPIPLFNNGVIPVTIYDVRNDEITRGSWDDLCPSTTPNADGSLTVDENTTMAFIFAANYRVFDVMLVKY